MKVKVKPVMEIGSHEFKVHQNEQVYDDGHDGTTSFRTGRVCIAPNVLSNRKAVVLIHEVLHIISNTYATSLSERDIEILSEGIAQYLFSKHNLGIELDWSEIKTIKIPE